ncbi:glutaredoxin family protein [Vibrio tapetis]|uniref:Thiol-disulfide isomerase and thioredoxin n=1 Tax=Vibrio tapetis subsp. tapetis TaxID=1671868 RepID=A0A2N8Z9K4_9VIBR|nr:glutaredoxin family protein [Vibrio tapetis]SON48591.1 Thiol-disulfide isomerase and thioredoxin [Vibrio tapetis subsp. tapetis]
MITLYSTQGCHLCEMAFELTCQLGIDGLVKTVDIAFDDALFSRYGVTIPVLQYGSDELGWPFTLQELQIWLGKHGINYHT